MKPDGNKSHAGLRKYEGWNTKQPFKANKGLTPTDLEEISKFQQLLLDLDSMSNDELWEKYGEDYLGPKH